MSWTKREFVTQAYEEIGLANYVFDLEPEQLQSACRRMDAMIAAWDARGIHIGYPLSGSPSTTDLDTDTGVPDYANEAIYKNLAIRLGASMGISISPDIKQGAKEAYTTMLMASMDAPIEYSMPRSLNKGAGAKDLGRPYMDANVEAIDVGPDSEITFE